MTQPEQHPTHAGTVVYRDAPLGWEFLVISAKNRPDEFVLPKGHIDTGETPRETALRELAEETGCEAELIVPLGVKHFKARNESVATVYFLARLHRQGKSAERRTLFWLPYAEAVSRLSFPEAQAILTTAHEEVKPLSGDGSSRS